MGMAFRETGVSRHHGKGTIEGPPETPRTSQHYRIGEFKGSINWVPIMPKDVGLSDNKYESDSLTKNKQHILYESIWHICRPFQHNSSILICFCQQQLLLAEINRVIYFSQ